MSKSLNICAISGNLTKDPELRTTNGGHTVASLSVAVNDREKVNGEWQDRPSYFDVTVFGTTAENCAKYMSKGSHVQVQGKLRQDRWETNDGGKRSAVKIVADSVVFPRKSDSDQAPRYADQGRAATPKEQLETAGIPVSEDDDIPW